MKEKLTELIKQAKYCTAEELAEYLIAAGLVLSNCDRDCRNCWKTKLANPVVTDNDVGGKWIPVTERLPGFEIERVLVMTRGDFILGYPKMDTDRYVDRGWVRYGDNVTHWMSLPEPPEEV